MSYFLLAILKIVQNVCMYYLKNMFHTTRDLISSKVCVVCRFDDNKIPLIYVPLLTNMHAIRSFANYISRHYVLQL